MNEKKFYKIKEISKLASVSVRTLHYYDEIGLLRAKRNHTNGYRYYTLSDAVCLQQIILYRKLDLPLEEIRRIITASGSLMETLKNQHALMLQRQKETQSIIENLEMAMSTLKGESNIDILFDSIPQETSERWKKKIISSKSGNSILQTYGDFSESDMKEKARRADEWCKHYTSVLSKNVDDSAVQDLMGELYIITNQELADVTPEYADNFLDSNGYKAFVESSKANGILKDLYGHYADGFADHLYRAMLHFCDNQLKTNASHWKAKIHVD